MDVPPLPHGARVTSLAVTAGTEIESIWPGAVSSTLEATGQGCPPEAPALHRNRNRAADWPPMTIGAAGAAAATS